MRVLKLWRLRHLESRQTQYIQMDHLIIAMLGLGHVTLCPQARSQVVYLELDKRQVAFTSGLFGVIYATGRRHVPGRVGMMRCGRSGLD